MKPSFRLAWKYHSLTNSEVERSHFKSLDVALSYYRALEADFRVVALSLDELNDEGYLVETHDSFNRHSLNLS